MAENQPIIIIGAGIAGLSTALALAKKGFSVEVYEKVLNLQEVGAGVQLAPNATRILNKWGILNSIQNVAVQPENLFLNNGMNGRILLDLPIRQLSQERWNGVYLTIHRADLQNTLYEAVLQNPHVKVHLGYSFSNAQTQNNQVVATFEHNDRTIKAQTPLLIGADGVWSALRRLNDKQEQTIFTGYIAWRATIDADKVPETFTKIVGDKPNVSAWMGPNNHLVAYPLKSGKSYNFVAIAHGDNPGETWSKAGDQKQLFSTFRAWHPVMRDIVMSTNDWTYWPLFGMKNYHFIKDSRQIYVGDAAHAFLPFAAQGAVMAIEDAATLAECLNLYKADLDEALKLYNHLRGPRVEQVNKRGRFNSLVYHATGPIAFGRNIAMKFRPTKSFAADLDWLYNYDASTIIKK